MRVHVAEAVNEQSELRRGKMEGGGRGPPCGRPAACRGTAVFSRLTLSRVSPGPVGRDADPTLWIIRSSPPSFRLFLCFRGCVLLLPWIFNLRGRRTCYFTLVFVHCPTRNGTQGLAPSGQALHPQSAIPASSGLLTVPDTALILVKSCTVLVRE